MSHHEVNPGEHTPTPWEVVPERVLVAEPERCRVTIRSKSRLHFVIVAEDFSERFDQTLIDYDFIVKAVNSYDALVAAAKEAIDLLDADVDNALDAIITLRAALALVEGK